LLLGAAPFDIKYEEHRHPERRSKSLSNRELNGALGTASIRMDTSMAGTYEYKFSQPSDANYARESKRVDALIVSQSVHSRPSAAFSSPGKTYSYCSHTEQSSGEEHIPVTFTGVPPFYLEVELKKSGIARPSILTFPNIPNNVHDIRIPISKLESGHFALTVRKVRDARECTRRFDTTPNPRDKNPPSRVQIAVFDAPSIAPLESKSDFCVGDRISFTLSGQQPFSVFYHFDGGERKANVPSNTFRRITERPGLFNVTSIQDSASSCRAPVHIERRVHRLPSVRVSKGKIAQTDIHEGGSAELLFEFEGAPPFTFTYTRSENVKKGSSKKPQILETKTVTSEEYEHRREARDEGTYEVIAIRDAYCSYARPGVDFGGGKGQKLLQY
jgi:nucleoporin POM152